MLARRTISPKPNSNSVSFLASLKEGVRYKGCNPEILRNCRLNGTRVASRALEAIPFRPMHALFARSFIARGFTAIE